jgi:hypothetical protein
MILLIGAMMEQKEMLEGMPTKEPATPFLRLSHQGKSKNPD